MEKIRLLKIGETHNHKFDLLKGFHSEFPTICESPIRLRKLSIIDDVYPHDDMDMQYFHGKIY